MLCFNIEILRYYDRHGLKYDKSKIIEPKGHNGFETKEII